MKYVKLFENFINESNELIKAQGDCKAAIFIVQKEIDKFLNDLMKAGFIASFKTTVTPYNQGYELEITADHRDLWKKRQMTPQEEFISNWISSNGYIYLQPSSYFQDSFEDGKGAYIEGVELQMRSGNRSYPRFGIKTKADITKATKDWTKLILDQISDSRKTAGI